MGLVDFANGCVRLPQRGRRPLVHRRTTWITVIYFRYENMVLDEHIIAPGRRPPASSRRGAAYFSIALVTTRVPVLLNASYRETSVVNRRRVGIVNSNGGPFVQLRARLRLRADRELDTCRNKKSLGDADRRPGTSFVSSAFSGSSQFLSSTTYAHLADAPRHLTTAMCLPATSSCLLL
jgi:hypothetical protein